MMHQLGNFNGDLLSKSCLDFLQQAQIWRGQMKFIFIFQASLGGLPSVCRELSMREFPSCGLNFRQNKSELEIIPLIMLYTSCLLGNFQERQCLNMISIENTVNAGGGYIPNGIRLLQFCFFTTSSFYLIVPNSVCITPLCVFASSEWSGPQGSPVWGETWMVLLTGFLPFTESCYGAFSVSPPPPCSLSQ